MDIGARGGHQRIGVRGPGRDAAPVLLEPHADGRLRVGAFRDRVDLEELQVRLVRIDFADRLEDRIDRAVAVGLRRAVLAVDAERDLGLGRYADAGLDAQRLIAIASSCEAPSSMSAVMSSSKTCFFLSARSLKRRNASSTASLSSV